MDNQSALNQPITAHLGLFRTSAAELALLQFRASAFLNHRSEESRLKLFRPLQLLKFVSRIVETFSPSGICSGQSWIGPQEPARGVDFPNHLAEKHLMDFISLASYLHTSPTVRQLTSERRHFEKNQIRGRLSHRQQFEPDGFNCAKGGRAAVRFP